MIFYHVYIHIYISIYIYCGGPVQRSHILLDLEALFSRPPGVHRMPLEEEDEQNRWRKAKKKEKGIIIWRWRAGRKQACVQTPFETRPWIQRYKMDP